MYLVQSTRMMASFKNNLQYEYLLALYHFFTSYQDGPAVV
jgi:hypothetical protein